MKDNKRIRSMKNETISKKRNFTIILHDIYLYKKIRIAILL